MGRNLLWSVYWVYSVLRLLGVAVHEIAHAGAVLLSGGRITEFAITSHVTHEGRYSLPQQIVISYAPLVVNTGLAGLFGFGSMWLPGSDIPPLVSEQLDGIVSVTQAALGLHVAALLVAFSLAATALPSLEDALSPFQRASHNIRNPTIRRVVALPFELPILVVFVIPLAFAYVRSRSFALSIVSEIGFAAVVLAQATGAVDIVYILSSAL